MEYASSSTGTRMPRRFTPCRSARLRSREVCPQRVGERRLLPQRSVERGHPRLRLLRVLARSRGLCMRSSELRAQALGLALRALRL